MRLRPVSLFTLALLAACAGDEEAPAVANSATDIPEVHFTTHDFSFEGPASIEAGLVTFVLANEGETLHHVQLVRLPDDMTFDSFREAMAQMQPGSPPPPWFEDAGGVNPPPFGGVSRVTQAVEAGEYAVLCLVDTPDKVPHVMKGMMQPLTVTPSTKPVPQLPQADLSLTLVDYAFSFSEPPTSGTRTVRVENGASQSHEIVILRLLPGKTMDDLGAWAATYDGPPPAEPVGGVPGIHPGQVVNMEIELEPGDYAALCFIPDATDGRFHTEHGMVMPFTVS